MTVFLEHIGNIAKKYVKELFLKKQPFNSNNITTEDKDLLEELDLYFDGKTIRKYN